MKKLLALLSVILLFSSCEKVIEFDTSSSESQLVLNGVPSADKQLFVNFAYTHFFLDTTNNNPVGGVDMAVLVNGQEYRPVRTDRCNYFFDYILHEDDNLSITVRAGDRTATAQTYVPRFPIITNLNAFTYDSAFHFLLANFNIEDHPDYDDYYCVTVHQRDSGCRYIPYLDKYDTIDTTYNTLFFSNDPAIIDPQLAAMMSIGGFVPSDRMLFTDDRIAGQLHNTTLMLMLLRDTNEVIPYIHQYTLDIETVTPDRYRYLQDIANATSILQLITEPPAVYSNVSGALGIFAGNARRTYPLYTIHSGYKPPRRAKK